MRHFTPKAVLSSDCLELKVNTKGVDFTMVHNNCSLESNKISKVKLQGEKYGNPSIIMVRSRIA